MLSSSPLSCKLTAGWVKLSREAARDLVEDQITYPLVRALQSTPGVQTVRGYSMFGMSFTYALFDEGTDIYWARTRVLEQLGRVQQLLPPGVSPTLGPDASGVGWVYQYVLTDATGRLDLSASEARPFVDQRQLWEGNSVLRGQPPSVDTSCDSYEPRSRS